MKRTTLYIRVTDETKCILQQAAKIRGTTVSDFVLSIAIKTAYEIIQNQNHFCLSNEQWNIFYETLDRAPTKNINLKALFNNKKIFVE